MAQRDIPYVIFHRPGPKWDHTKSFFEQDGLEKHVAHYRQLLAAQKLSMGGPFMDDQSGGMMIPSAGLTEEEMRDFAEADPLVKSRLLTYEIRPWMIGLKASA